MQTRGAQKLRGSRRHFAKLERDSRLLIHRVATGEPFDLFHHHFDFRGFGVHDPRVRHRHLKMLFSAFEGVIEAAQKRSDQMQVFVSIAPAADSGQDALYLNSQSGDGGQFPYRYPGVQWRAKVPAVIAPFIANRPWQVGQMQFESAVWWVVAMPEDPGLAV